MYRMKRNRPLAVVGLTLVLGLALLAIANALWFQTLSLHASVSTAEVKVEWTGMSCQDNETASGFHFRGWPNPSKDVGKFTNDVGDDLTLTLSNAYPGYGVDCELELVDTGNVPVHLEQWEITVDDPSTPQNPDLVVHCTKSPCKTRPGGPELYLPIGDPIYGELVDGIGCQLHADDQMASSFRVGVRQTAHENTTYVVKLHAQFNQWNESAWNGCGDPKSTPVVPVLPLDVNGTPYDPSLLGISHQP